ncbi:hypothetical protein [Myceligenerans crystallogenes]|uniref:SdpI/YhfL protein family protein n=1 Tax=Myceligenerans crystallogenes TaxID=316335 RepID=A0ABP4ZD80_9MICO
MPQTQGVSLSYRYLRVAIVSMVLVLFIALALQIAADRAAAGPGQEWWFASISTYFYTPVQNVFVGVLFVAGICMIAVKGRDGGEDVLLNFAGMTAILSAMVPTPLTPAGCAGEPYCLDVPERVANNVLALLLAGIPVLLLAAWPRRGDLVRGAGWDLWLTWLAWGAVAAWMSLWPAAFLGWAHYVAALAFFACLIAVAWVNGRDQQVTGGPGERTRGLRPQAYRRAYRAIAITMTAVIVVGLAALGAAEFLGWRAPAQTVFVVEALLLLIFAGFWILQTIEFWEIGLPAKARNGE